MTTETTTAGGQATTDSPGTTVNAPNGDAGTSVSSAQTTGNGPVADAIESFFDPASIKGKPELESAYKQMQGSYSKRMQEMAKHRPKIDAYDRFEKDPLGTMRQLATQFGYQLVQQGQDPAAQEKTFNSWDDVEKHFFDKFQREALNPVVNEVRSLKKQSIEMQLDKDYPDWRTYEHEMMETLQKHPTLVSDHATLYRMSVPASVLEARATKAAMEKLKGTTVSAQVSGGTTVRQTTQAPSGPLTFQQAYDAAKAKLAGRPAG
jgi:hypothetical protein